MQTYADMTKEQLQEELTKVRQIYKEYQDKGLKLDMSRGKPSSGQLDLGMGLLNAVDAESLMQAETVWIHVITADWTASLRQSVLWQVLWKSDRNRSLFVAIPV